MRTALSIAVVLCGMLVGHILARAQCSNIISNPTFECTWLAYSDQEFADGYVPSWEESHGKPRVLPDNVFPAVSAPNYCLLYAGFDNYLTSGIKQHIGPLHVGVPYIFSFWVRALDTSTSGGPTLDSLMVYFTDISPTGSEHVVPTVANKQLVTSIFNLQGSGNFYFTQYRVCVTPTQPWEYLWITAMNHDSAIDIGVMLDDVELAENGSGFAGPDDTVCAGHTATIGSPGAGDCLHLPALYTWSTGGSTIGTGRTIPVSPMVTTTYIVERSFDSVDCPGYDTVTVVVDTTCCHHAPSILPNDGITHLPLPVLQNPTYVVEHDELWTGTMAIDCDIYVPAGVTLTIQGADVSFQNCNTLIVGQGGRLVLDGSHLGNCSWKGIEVWGYYDVQQRDTIRPGIPGSGQIGLVRARGTTIDHAEIGIFAGARYSPSSFLNRLAYGGGVVNVDGCTFENNYVDIAFAEYSTIWVQCGVNLSRVVRSHFGTRLSLACTDWMSRQLRGYGGTPGNCHIVDFSDNLGPFNGFLGCACGCVSGLRSNFTLNTYAQPCPPSGPNPNNGWN